MAPLTLPMPPPPIGAVPLLNVPPPQLLLAPGQGIMSALAGSLPPANLNPFSVPPPNTNVDNLHGQVKADNKEKNSHLDEHMDIDDEDRGTNMKNLDYSENSQNNIFPSEKNKREMLPHGHRSNIEASDSHQNKSWNATRSHGSERESKLNDRRNERDRPLQDRLRELAYPNNRGMNDRDFNRDYPKRADSGNNSFAHKRGNTFLTLEVVFFLTLAVLQI